MSSVGEWLRRARWTRRSKPFGKLLLRHDPHRERIVAFQFELVFDAAAAMWDHWVKRVRHPAVIPAIEPGLLRYTALDWVRYKTRLDSPEAEREVATLGLELVDVMYAAVEVVGLADSWWFTNPIVNRDLEGNLRVAFAKPVARSGGTSERAMLVVGVGRGLQQLVAGHPRGSALGTVIERCIHQSDYESFDTLKDVTKALRRAGGAKSDPRPRSHLLEAIDQALGYWGYRDRPSALECLDAAIAREPTPTLVELRDLIANAPLEDPDIVESSWQDGSLFYAKPQPIAEDPVSRVPVPRVFQNAYDLLHPKQVARTIEPAAPIGTPEQQVEDLLHRRRYRDALDKIEGGLAGTPEEPHPHHLRGKALLALGRLPEARAAFDRACTLQPKLLEAMLLRREVDRVMAATRASAGIANPMASGLPDHLAELRDVLVSGRIVDAIQMLKRPTYDDDEVAQLLLADLLIRDERADEALGVLAPITADESYELRAQALRKLGRTEEAEVQMSSYLRRIEQRSDRRIGSR